MKIKSETRFTVENTVKELEADAAIVAAFGKDNLDWVVAYKGNPARLALILANLFVNQPELGLEVNKILAERKVWDEYHVFSQGTVDRSYSFLRGFVKEVMEDETYNDTNLLYNNLLYKHEGFVDDVLAYVAENDSFKPEGERIFSYWDDEGNYAPRH